MRKHNRSWGGARQGAHGLRASLQAGFRAGLQASLASMLCLACAASLSAAPLGLAEARNLAAARSGVLLTARLERERSAGGLAEAKARALPKLSFTGSTTYIANPSEGFELEKNRLPLFLDDSYSVVYGPLVDLPLIPAQENTYFKFSLGLEQVLYTGGKIDSAIKAAALEGKVSEEALRGAERGLARDLGLAYFGAVLARDSLALLQRAEALMAEVVTDRQKGYENGTVTLQELLDARSQAAGLAARRAAVEESLATGLSALEYYTGRRLEAADLSDKPRSRLPVLDEAALLKRLSATSPDLASLRYRIEQAALAEKIDGASRPFRPDLSLSVSAELAGQDIPYLVEDWDESWDWNVYLTLGGKIPLLDSGTARAKLAQSEARRRQAEAGLEELSRSLPLQLRRLIEASKSAAAAIEEKKAALALATERARVAGSAFENELITRAEERGARVAALAAELDLAYAGFRLESALLELERLVGAGL